MAGTTLPFSEKFTATTFGNTPRSAMHVSMRRFNASAEFTGAALPVDGGYTAV